MQTDMVPFFCRVKRDFITQRMMSSFLQSRGTSAGPERNHTAVRHSERPKPARVWLTTFWFLLTWAIELSLSPKSLLIPWTNIIWGDLSRVGDLINLTASMQSISMSTGRVDHWRARFKPSWHAKSSAWRGPEQCRMERQAEKTMLPSLSRRIKLHVIRTTL